MAPSQLSHPGREWAEFLDKFFLLTFAFSR